jgi:hypothetical protein
LEDSTEARPIALQVALFLPIVAGLIGLLDGLITQHG